MKGIHKICICLAWFTFMTVDYVRCGEIGNLENRLNILEQKFSLQSFEFSLLRQELNKEKSERVTLEERLEELMTAVTDVRGSDTSHRTPITVTNDKVTQQRDLMEGILRAFKNEKAERIKLNQKVIQLEEEIKAEKEARLKMERDISLSSGNFQDETGNNFKAIHKEITTLKQSMAKSESEVTTLKLSMANFESEQSHVTGVILPEKVESLRNDLNVVKDVLDKKTDGLATNYANLNNNYQSLRTNLNKLQEYNDKNKVSFSARLTKSIDNIQPWATVVFSHVITNYENSYSGITGEFTAPISGTYIFYTHILGGHERGLEMVLQMNGQNQMWLYVNGPGHGSDSNMIVLNLKKEDIVKVVKHGPWGARPFYIHPVWSTFSGFLLFPK